MNNKITLHHRTPEPIEQFLMQETCRLMPADVQWVSRTRGRGPWREFLDPNVDDLAIFAMRSGERQSLPTYAINMPQVTEDGVSQWREELFRVMQAATIVNVHIFGREEDITHMLLVRRTSLIILKRFRKSVLPTNANYCLNQANSGHDTLTDLSELETLFPERFIVAG